MRFADKLFLWMMALLAFIFSCFGIWMLHSNFTRILDREIKQAKQESQMFQYLFEMGYQTNKEYGGTYAVNKTLDGIMTNIERADNHCFVLMSSKEYLYGQEYVNEENLDKDIQEITAALEEDNTYAYGIRRLHENQYIMLCVSVSQVDGETIYLGMSRDITLIYQDRENMLTQYRIVLLILLVISGGSIYFLSQYITAPIRKLKVIASQIERGNYSSRSDIHTHDELGELSESFNNMADELVNHMQEKEQEAKQKEDFTASFAHELKTPLTSIIGYADMLNTMKMTEEESREAYYYIYSQGKRLESLSHKLLDLVSMGKNPIHFVPNQTKDIAENIWLTMRPIWKAKNIKGKVHLEKGIIYGDMELLLSLFYNILDNAVKAVEPGGFILMKGAYVQHGYEIKIVDNGRGIPQEEISRITEAFYMVDKSRSRKEGGAGIGMALCKQIIDLHQGTLSISSKLEMGTVVDMIFPSNITEKKQEVSYNKEIVSKK